MKLDRRYLTKRTTVDEIKRRINFKTAPPEFQDDWDRLLKKIQPGDELWEFAPPNDPLAYQVWGIALVRHGEMISTLIEAVS